MKDENIKQIHCGASHTIIEKNDGTLVGFGCNDCKPDKQI